MNAMSKIKARALTVVVASALAAGGIGMLSQPASAKTKTPKSRISRSVPNVNSFIPGFVAKPISNLPKPVQDSAKVANTAICDTTGPLPGGVADCETPF